MMIARVNENCWERRLMEFNLPAISGQVSAGM